MLLLPENTEDLLYAAYQDRLVAKTLVNPGVILASDFEISLGVGLQLNINRGNAWVAQTNATQESSNSFYNGLYEVASTTETTPSNNVTVSSVNPQIAQIILRVYDVNELKIGGSSYVKLEWLNGTPSSNASESRMKERYYDGAAALPQSSFRIARVLVPKNATSCSEYYIEDTRTYANSKFPPGGIPSTSLGNGTFITRAPENEAAQTKPFYVSFGSMTIPATGSVVEQNGTYDWKGLGNSSGFVASASWSPELPSVPYFLPVATTAGLKAILATNAAIGFSVHLENSSGTNTSGSFTFIAITPV